MSEEEKDILDYSKEFIAGSLAGHGGMGALGAYGNKITESDIDRFLNLKTDRKKIKNVQKELAKQMDIEEIPVKRSRLIYHNPSYIHPRKPEGILEKGIFSLLGLEPSVRYSGDDPGILAHEMGHAKNFKKSLIDPVKRMKIYSNSLGLSSAASALSPLAGLAGDYSNEIGLGSLALASPYLYEETLASGRGGKALYDFYRKAGEGRLSSIARGLGAFKGLPTYYMLAGMPWLAAKAGELAGDL